jgi:hypothetical protein
MNSEHDKFLSMALSYLEIGTIASSADSDLKNVYEYENAVAYQMFHAIELFYKYMIKRKTGEISLIHDLEKLEIEYSKLYPKNNCKIDHPFDFKSYSPCELNENEVVLLENHTKMFKPKFMDQHLRYPADHRTGGYSFSLDASTFENVKDQLLRIAANDC